MSKRNQGFTLIELLVVIAIIGILSSVVLASLSTARNKGTDARIKGELSQLRAASELYYDGAGDYGATLNTCTGAFFQDGLTGFTPGQSSGMGAIVASLQGISTAADPKCVSTGVGWAVSYPLNGGTATAGPNWCVDHSGVSKQITAAIPNGDVSC